MLIILCSALIAEEITLDVYLQKVIQASYERYEVGLQTDEIDAQKRQLIAGYFPALSYSLNLSQSEQGPRDVFVGSVPISQPATTYEYHSTALNLSQQFFDWGNSFRKKERLKLNKDAIESDFMLRARTLTEQALILYFQLVEANEILEILKQELSETQILQKHLKNLVERGVKPPMDKLQMDITLNEVMSKINSQEFRVAQYRAEVSFLINEPIDTAFTLLPPAEFEQLIEFNPSIPNPASNYLTDQIKINELELSILKWDRMPDVYFNAGYSRGNTFFKSLYTNFDKDWYMHFSLSLSLPLFKNRQYSLQETRKWIQILRLTQQLDIEKKKIDKQVYILLKQIQKDKEQIVLQEENIKNYENIFTHELDRYNSGLIDYRILKDAKNILLQSRQSQISLKYSSIGNKEKLKLLLGEWDEAILAIIEK
ncbi:TolC family protein [candidate division KSB1 bacterium]|nr:TolC family protein [candidate division KSB1 bacterium]